MSILLDTLVFSQRLRAAGISQEHAEAHAEVARDVVLVDAVSQSELRSELAQFRAELKAFEETLVNRVWRTAVAIVVGALGVTGTLAAIIANSGKIFGK